MVQAVFPVSAPVINPALGSDLSGVSDLDPTMAEVSGRLCLSQNLARRLITPRGTLIDDPNYGYDLTQYLNADIGPSDIAQIQAGVEAEFLKDERVLDATIVAQFVGPTQVQAALTATIANPQPVPLGVLIITATVTDSTGPFTLVLSVSNVTVTLLAVSV